MSNALTGFTSCIISSVTPFFQLFIVKTYCYNNVTLNFSNKLYTSYNIKTPLNEIKSENIKVTYNNI